MARYPRTHTGTRRDATNLSAAMPVVISLRPSFHVRDRYGGRGPCAGSGRRDDARPGLGLFCLRPRQLSVVVVVVVHHGSWITRIVSHPWTQCTAVTRSPPGPSASRPPPPPTPFAASRWTPQRGMTRMVRDAARGPWGVQAFRRLGDTMRHGRHHHLTRRVVTKHSTSGSVVRVRPIPKRTSAHTHTHTHT